MIKDDVTTVKTIVGEAGKFNYERVYFAEAVSSNRFLFCSGVIDADDRGKLPEEIADEFRLAFKGVEAVLKEGGASFTDIVEYTTYHVGLQAHMAVFMAVRDEFLSEPWPAWTAIGISELAMPGAHVEIRVTARVQN